MRKLVLRVAFLIMAVSVAGAWTLPLSASSRPVGPSNSASVLAAPSATTLVSPSGTISTGSPSFVWNAVSGSTRYAIYVSNTATGQATYLWYDAGAICSGSTCSVKLASALANGPYTWWVLTSDGTTNGAWSAPVNFTVSVSTMGRVTLVSPSGTVSKANPTYTWNTVSGATKYALYVSGSQTVYVWYDASAICSGSTCTVTPATTLGNGSYTWWVLASNGTTNGPWSAAMTFSISVSTIGRVTLVSPSSTVTSGSLKYTWNVVSGATKYYLYVSNGAGTQAISEWHDASGVCAGSTCSVTPAKTLTNDTFNWWVLASNGTTNGPWSAAMSFTVTAAPAPSSLPGFSHVYSILMENEESTSIIGNSNAPYINSLIAQYGLATNYTAVTHPSEPNYIALFSGSTQGVTDDGVHDLSARNVADQIEASGRTWKMFAQNVPLNCYAGSTASGGEDGTGNYARKHEPAISFTNISGNASRCGNITDFTHFDPAAANYEFITPNMCNDMHDCSIATGDNFLRGFVPRILNSTAWQQGGVLFLTFDEGSTSTGGGGKVVTIVIAPNVPAGFKSATAYNHYSLLRTIQDSWGLGCLANTCSANNMAEFFH